MERCSGHQWSYTFGSLMICVNCGRSRTAPLLRHYDRNGFVRPDSDQKTQEYNNWAEGENQKLKASGFELDSIDDRRVVCLICGAIIQRWVPTMNLHKETHE